MTLSGKMVGPYTLHDRIAEGRSGVVYAASALPKRREAAVKILKPSFAADRSLAQRYVRACNLAELRDARFFVSIVEAGIGDDGVPWVALEYSHGRTLAASIVEEGARSAERAARVVHGVAEALFALHKRGRAYGGLEPRKVMIEGSGETERARLLEAELSELLPDLRPDPAYVAPERIPGAGATSSSDVYALGVLIHHLISGAIPIGSPAVHDPSGLLKLADELMVRDPNARMVHAGHVLAALEKLGFSGATRSDSQRPARADSKRPARADSVRPRADSKRPLEAPPQAPQRVAAPRSESVVRVKPRYWPGVMVGLGIVFAIAAAIELARRSVTTPSAPARTVQIPREPIVVIAEPEIEERLPLIIPQTVVTPEIAPASIKTASPEPADTSKLEALFVELDAQLGKSLSDRGLVWDDLVRVEPERTKRWGRWYRKAEAPIESDLREHFSALDRAIARAERQARTSTGG